MASGSPSGTQSDPRNPHVDPLRIIGNRNFLHGSPLPVTDHCSTTDGEWRRMAMTAAVKDELSRVTVAKVSARKAEVSTVLRFAGGLHIMAGRVVVEAELDTGAVARRLRRDIGELF